jgi:flavin-dependent dehydrogenase
MGIGDPPHKLCRVGAIGLVNAPSAGKGLGMGSVDLIGSGPSMRLEHGSRVAVLGGGPAGSFFAYFLIETAERLGLALDVDVYESRDFSRPGPQGCNMCGGILSESLVQALATEGINLPPCVVQRGIDSYVLHTDGGDVRIDTPLQEQRIGAVHRGPGPRDLTEAVWESFDGHLLARAVSRGARVVQGKVTAVEWVDGRPRLRTDAAASDPYELLAVATGVNSSSLKMFAGDASGYQPPETAKTFICEYRLGHETIDRCLGNSMHVFLLDIPNLEFAAVIPKGDYATVCLLGDEISNELVDAFLDSAEVRACFPEDWDPAAKSCKCQPRINVCGARVPYADRLVFLGDSGVTRLYKDGIGAAYRTSKAAATAAVLWGVSAGDFAEHYGPACQAIAADNAIGKRLFRVAREVQKRPLARRTIVRMAEREQRLPGDSRRMSQILWNMFTGSATYLEIVRHAAHPTFVARLMMTVAGAWPRRRRPASRRGTS